MQKSRVTPYGASKHICILGPSGVHQLFPPKQNSCILFGEDTSPRPMAFAAPPLSVRPASAVPCPVLLGCAEVCQRLRLTARQLPWWEEQELLPACHEGHKRLYSPREAVLAGVMGTLRRAGLGPARLHMALQPIPGKGRGEPLPCYLSWTGDRDGAIQWTATVRRSTYVSTLGEGGIPSLLIDLEQIAHKLYSADF